MRKNLTQLLLAVLFLLEGISMTAQVKEVCGTDLERKKLIELYPEILEREADFEKRAAERLTSIMRIEGETIIIPVVFHIIHDYSGENISDEQVYDAIEHINAIKRIGTSKLVTK